MPMNKTKLQSNHGNSVHLTCKTRPILPDPRFRKQKHGKKYRNERGIKYFMNEES